MGVMVEDMEGEHNTLSGKMRRLLRPAAVRDAKKIPLYRQASSVGKRVVG